jgi:hypothetical protein
LRIAEAGQAEIDRKRSAAAEPLGGFDRVHATRSGKAANPLHMDRICPPRRYHAVRQRAGSAGFAGGMDRERRHNRRRLADQRP